MTKRLDHSIYCEWESVQNQPYRAPQPESQPQQDAPVLSLEARLTKEVMLHAVTKYELKQAKAALTQARPILDEFAREHPTWTDFTGRVQDPMGVHALRAALAATQPRET